VRLRGAALALILLALLAGAQTVPEPDGYRMSDFRSPVPATLGGARVLGTGEAHALWEAGTALFIDVLPRPPKPADLPEGTIWIDRKRLSIPGAHWFPNVGFGRLTPEMHDYFAKGLERLSGGDRAGPLVVFCLADCWMSWNAARRAVLELGFTAVAWYPDGTDGWQEAGYPLEEVQPEK